MLIKGVYHNKSLILRKKKDSFEIISEENNLKYKSVYVISPKEALVLPKDSQIHLKDYQVYEISDYKIFTKKSIDFENEDIWVFALLRALKAIYYDDIYVVFEDEDAFVICYIKDNKLIHYEMFFDKDEMLNYLNKLDKDILSDIDIDIKSLKPPFIKNNELLAFGGALKYINNIYEQDIISYQKLKKEISNIITLLMGILICYGIISFSINIENKDIKKRLEYTFKKAFPNTPIVDIKEQVEASIVPASSQFKLSKLLLKAYSNLPPDAKVYELDYDNQVLKIKSDVSQEDLSSLKNVVFSKNLDKKVQIIQEWKK